jgi:hypothetical protein
MAKNTKRRTTPQGKPITDFFTLASKSHPQPTPSSKMSSPITSQASPSDSEDIRPRGTLETTGVLNNSIHVASIASKRPIKSLSKVHGRDGSKSSHLTKKSLSKPPFASSAISSRSPGFQAHAGASTRLNNKKAPSDTIKVSDRRRRQCDSDSDIEMANTVVYVNSSVCHSSIS